MLGLCPANEKRRYKVTPSPIGWAQTYNQPCIYIMFLNMEKIFTFFFIPGRKKFPFFALPVLSFYHWKKFSKEYCCLDHMHPFQYKDAV